MNIYIYIIFFIRKYCIIKHILSNNVDNKRNFCFLCMYIFFSVDSKRNIFMCINIFSLLSALSNGICYITHTVLIQPYYYYNGLIFIIQPLRINKNDIIFSY